MSTIPFISFDQAEKLVKLALSKGITPYLKGSPSSGKTAIGTKIAKQANLKPIVFSLLDHDPTDMSGLPDLSGSKACFKPFDTFPIKGDPLPEGKQGWLICLDEFASGTTSMQAAANRLLYERMVGDKPLHPKAFVIAMGNLATDNAYVIEEPAHTKSRAMHLYVQQDIKEWITWAISAGVDSRVIAYAEMKPQLITKYDPDHVGINYPCARTMEMLSQIVKDTQLERWVLPAIQGVVGEGVGLEFYNFCQLANSLPTLEAILKNPTGATVPTQANQRYVLGAMLGDSFNKENAEVLLSYITRFPEDTQYFILRSAIHRDKTLINIPSVRDWSRPICAKYL